MFYLRDGALLCVVILVAGSPVSGQVTVLDTTLPTPREALSCATDPSTGKIYCYGGWDGSSNWDDILEYDPAADAIQVKTTCPRGSAKHSCAVDAATGRMYCFGREDYDYHDQILKYALPDGPCEDAGPVLDQGQDHLSCVAVPSTGKIYCFGGNTSLTYLDEIKEYDPATDSLRVTSAELPSPRASVSCAYSSTTGKIYCLGGSAVGGSAVPPLDEIIEYDPAYPDQDPVVVSATLPSGRWGLACAADSATGRVYCFGGHGGYGPGGGPIDEIVEYDPSLDTCVQLPHYTPTPRLSLSCATAPATGRIYCFGGYDESVKFDDIFTYSPPRPCEFEPDEHTVALWHLDGDGTDASGNGKDLTVKSDRVSWEDGYCGLAAEMGDDPWTGGCQNSDGGALTAPGSGCTYPGSGDWTVEAWVKFPTTSEVYVAVAHYSEHWAGHDPFELLVDHGTAAFQINTQSGASVTASADVSPRVGEWIHLAGVYRYQQDISLFLNGELIAVAPTTEVIEYLPGSDIYVGGHYCGTSSGLLVDEVHLSSTARDVPTGACGRALRDLSDTFLSYCPEVPKTVHLAIDAPDGTLAIGVEETPPPDWTDITSISDGGTYDPDMHKIKWGPFFAPDFPEEVTYEIVPPIDAEGEQCFAGEISIDGNDEPICGDECMSVSDCPFIPADEAQDECGQCADCSCAECEDHRVEMCEAIGYACAWKAGCNDKLAEMTRAAYIWVSGEYYCFDEIEGDWFPAEEPPNGCGCCTVSTVTTVFAGYGDPVDETQGGATIEWTPAPSAKRGNRYYRDVFVTVTAPEGTLAVALEIAIPKGSIVADISDGGVIDEVHRKVKWGPFFDDLSRTVGFSIRVPWSREKARSLTDSVRSAQPIELTGTVSFDGVNQPIKMGE